MWLVGGALVFLLVTFVVSRVGAEHGNHARFAFPDRLAGVKILSPDRAPEARGRDIVARYDRRGDGVAGMVVEWLPYADLGDVVADPASLRGEGRIRCDPGPEVLCVYEERDGVLRFTQYDASAAQVRDVAEAFSEAMKKPDSVG